LNFFSRTIFRVGASLQVSGFLPPAPEECNMELISR
jgi:hypothetical protein